MRNTDDSFYTSIDDAEVKVEYVPIKTCYYEQVIMKIRDFTREGEEIEGKRIILNLLVNERSRFEAKQDAINLLRQEYYRQERIARKLKKVTHG